jgi:DNA-binding NarL/FixJ family response regulator
MVLVEKITQKHEVDLEHAKAEYLLTNKEVRVLELLCRGCSNKEISAELFISEHTAKDHVKNIMRKMGTTSRSEVMALLA